MLKKSSLIFGFVLLPLALFADAPLNMSATGVTLADWIVAGASAALAIFTALYGLKIIIHAFKTVAGTDHSMDSKNARYDELLSYMNESNDISTVEMDEFTELADELNEYYGVDD